MKQTEIVYREILFQAIEKKNRTLTQAELAKTLNLSLSVINKAIKNIAAIGAVDINPRNFHIVDIRKILYYWASVRNLHKESIYTTRVALPVSAVEKNMPDDVVFGAYSAHKFLFNDVPADYSEIYVYGDSDLKKRFPEQKGIPNLFVLKKDPCIERYGKKTTIAQTFVDLWNLKEWYAKEFITAMEERFHGILE